MLQVRKLMESDWKIINSWFKKSSSKSLIDKDTFRKIMPGAFQLGNYEEKRIGLGGFMVCKENHPIAATWLYLGNGNCAMPMNIISDSNYKDTDKNDAIQILVNFTTDFAKDLGYKYTFTYTNNQHLLKSYLNAGYKKEDTLVNKLIKKL